MSKFAKGTWSVGIDKKYGPYVYADDNDAIIAVIRSCGHVSESNEKEAVRYANARLIAAAPEMYEALQETLDFIENIISRKCPECTQDAEDMREFLEELLARIDGSTNRKEGSQE